MGSVDLASLDRYSKPAIIPRKKMMCLHTCNRLAKAGVEDTAPLSLWWLGIGQKNQKMSRLENY